MDPGIRIIINPAEEPSVTAERDGINDDIKEGKEKNRQPKNRPGGADLGSNSNLRLGNEGLCFSTHRAGKRNRSARQ